MLTFLVAECRGFDHCRHGSRLGQQNQYFDGLLFVPERHGRI